jgi:hypothetical protein
MPVTAENEVESEGEQAIPLHRHGFEAVVFHPAMRSPRERSLKMDSWVLFRRRGGAAAAAAAKEACRRKKEKKESSSSGSDKPLLEQEQYLRLLSTMAAGPGLFLGFSLTPCRRSISGGSSYRGKERKKISSVLPRFLGNHGYLVVILLVFAPHLSAAETGETEEVGCGIFSIWVQS